jgi:cobalt-zinc-cadmium efflux system outer membrane protein
VEEIMPQIRMRFASLALATGLCAAALPIAAQESLTENAAIARALAREGIGARDDANRAEAAAGVRTIGPLDNPDLQLTRQTSGGSTEWQLGIVQPIDLSGSRSALRRAARSEATAVENEIAWRRQQLIGETRRAYVGCAAAGAELQVWRAYATDLAEAARIAEARAREGDTAVYDVRRTRVALSAVTAELRLAEGERSAGCALLAALTGFENPQIPPSAITELRSGGVTGSTRADLAAQEARLEAASQRLTAARRARLPQVALGAGVWRVDEGAGASYGPMLSLGVSLPLWNGGGAAVAEAQAQASAREAELVIARRTIAAEQQAAATRTRAARDAALAAAEARDDAARLGTIASTAYQAGEIGVVELIDAYEAQADGELSVIAHARRAAEAAIAFDLATGRTDP